MITNQAKSISEYQEIVEHPGKFEGEPAYTPYFYDLMMEGDGEDISNEGDSPIISFEIYDYDIKLFPELAVFTHFELILPDIGFIYGHNCIIK